MTRILIMCKLRLIKSNGEVTINKNGVESLIILMASGVILISCNTIEEGIEKLSWVIIANQLQANATQQPKEVMYWRNT